MNNLIKRVLAKLEDKLPGGLADNLPDSDFDLDQLAKGIEIEMEHVNDPSLAKEIAKDHLAEVPNYYLKNDNSSRIDILEEEAEEEYETKKVAEYFEDSILTEIGDLDRKIKKYHLVVTNIEDIKENIEKYFSDPEMRSKFPVKESRANFEMGKDDRDFSKDLAVRREFEFQKKKLTAEFKKWINNFRAHLNKIKIQNKELDTKSILTAFTKFEIRINN